MALHHQMIVTFFFIVVVLIAKVDLSTSQVVKGSVSCLNCKKDYDLSDIKIAFKCQESNKKLTVTNTKKDGTFKIELPMQISASNPSLNCLASVLGGRQQLFIKRKNMVTNVHVMLHDSTSSSYTITSPLSFYTSCPLSHGRCIATNASTTGSVKIDLPVPREWGLPPTSYYVPFFPIIGIP